MRRLRRGLARACAIVAGCAVVSGPTGGAVSRPNDPLYAGDGQWALQRVGFTPPGRGGSAWDAGTGDQPVVVAVLDTGLDYHHPDLAPESVWRNPGEQANGRDDDGNGYVDDLIGWNFVDGDNNPWDRAGHGTHVAGIIAAATDNAEGIAGINPRVRIMPLKVMNFMGRGRSSGIAAAIYYAVGQGARLINLSLGGEKLSRTERLAIDWAHERGALVVVAAGNSGVDLRDFGPAGLTRALTVAATGRQDERTAFSNWGQAVDLAAPGVDVLSLRARRTDFLWVSGAADYVPGRAFVGEGARYYRATGTSFAAPFVTGVASLLLSRDPTLSNAQLERMLLMSSDDVEVPGWDQYTGVGRLNALRALRADPDWFLLARLSGVNVARTEDGPAFEVCGSVEGSDAPSWVIELGRGSEPDDWKAVGARHEGPAEACPLGVVPLSAIGAPGTWTVRLRATDARGETREARGTIEIARKGGA